MRIALLVLLLLTWPLQWCIPSGNAPSQRYVTVRKTGASYAAIDTFAGPVDSLRMTYGQVYRIHARALGGGSWTAANSCGDPRTAHDAILLALDWVPPTGATTVEYGRVVVQAPGCPETGIVVFLLAPDRWQVTASFQDSIPVWVRAKSSFDYDGNGIVNLGDFSQFVTREFLPASGGDRLTLLAKFSMHYQQRTRVWP